MGIPTCGYAAGVMIKSAKSKWTPKWTTRQTVTSGWGGALTRPAIQLCVLGEKSILGPRAFTATDNSINLMSSPVGKNIQASPERQLRAGNSRWAYIAGLHGRFRFW